MDMAFSSNDSFSMDSNSNQHSGMCRLCRAESHQRCKRCSDFYCSDKCQAIDWPNHRYICFPMPPLVSNKELLTDESIFQNELPGVVDNGKLFEEFQILKNLILKTMQSVGNNISNVNSSNAVLNDTSTDSSDELLSAQSQYGAVKPCMKKKNGNHSRPPRSRVSLLNNNNGTNWQSTPENGKFNSNDLVILCGFRSTNRCGVRPKTPKIDAAFAEHASKIDNWGKSAPVLRKQPEINSYAIAHRNKLFCRVKIVSIPQPDRIRVMFCDYGNVSFRHLDDLREISEEIEDLPCFMTVVQLKDVYVFQYNENNTRYMSSLENKIFRIEYQAQNLNSVTLFDVENGAMLNEKLVEACNEFEDQPGSINGILSLLKPKVNKKEHETKKDKMGAVKNVENKATMKAPFRTHVFPYNSRNINAIIVDTSLVEQGYIACIKRDDMPKLLKVQQHLEKTPEHGELYEPRLGEYVIARFEDSWYRGHIVNISKDNRYDIIYNDFLNEATVTSADIRPYPTDLDIDCYTSLCIIDGLSKDLEPEQSDFLKNKLQINDVIYIDRVVQMMDENTVLVECIEIIAEMNSKNLL